MRVAFLCKRRYMGKDVVADRYARLYEIPYQLARLGHDVLGLTLSYHGDPEGVWQHEAAPGSLRWASSGLGRTVLPGLLAYPAKVHRRLQAFRPDVVIGASDLPHIVLAAHVAARLRCRLVADLYDNFESFGLSRVPGFVPLYRRAVRRADVVTCTSEALAQHVRDDYAATGTVVAVPSTVDKSVFRLHDRDACRRSLGLPVTASLIGTAGGLHADKGVGVLYDAFHRLAGDSNVHLVLAGPIDSSLSPPQGERVHYLGQLPHAKVAELFGALDVGVIYLRDTPFGRYCFPQKAYEMLACGLPVVAADVGAMGSLFAGTPNALFAADDAAALTECVRAQLLRPAMPAVEIEDWEQIVRRIEPLLRGGRPHSPAPH